MEERNNEGASGTLLREWAEESREDYKNHLRMSEADFLYLLGKVTPHIQKRDTNFREALPERMNLEVSQRCIASDGNLATLSASYRIPKSTSSRFFREVCVAIYNALEEFIQVSIQG